MLTTTKAFSFISFLALIVAIVLFFPQPEKQPELPVIEVKPQIIPNVELYISSKEDCVEVYRNNTPGYGVLNLLLSSARLEQINYESMLYRIRNIGYMDKGKSIKLTGKNDNTTFYELQSNTTYYLYYFEETEGVRSHLEMKTIRTKIKEISFDKILEKYESLITLIAGSVMVFICLLLLKKGLRKTSSKKKRVQNSAKPYNAAAEKVKTDWKLDLPDTYEIRMKRKTGKYPLLERKETEINNVNKHLEDDNREFEDRRICGLCCDRPREVIFLDCGHIYSCTKCAKELIKCPIDNKPIKERLRFRVCDKYGIKDTIIPELTHNSIESLANSAPSAFFKSIKKELTSCEQYIVLKEQHDNYDYFYKCVMCNQRSKDMLFSDCCHLVCCSECSKGMERCPIDKVKITKSYPVFFA